jgi:general secretion pathway protein M
MRDWFDSLQPREQVSVLVAAVFVTFAVIYFGLWRPLASSQASLSDSVTTWERALADIRPLKAAVKSSGSSARPAPGAGQSMVVIVDTTVGQHNLSGALQRSQPTGQTGIRVEFQDAAFDDLVRWLGDLATRYGMQVQSGNFSTSSRGVPGRVNASLTIEW